MTTNWPTGVDSFSDPTPSTAMNNGTQSHSAMHTLVNDAIHAMQSGAGAANGLATVGSSTVRTVGGTNAPTISVDTAANWAANNPVLGALEIAYDDAGIVKRGDGATAYNSLNPILSGTYGRVYTKRVTHPIVSGGRGTQAASALNLLQRQMVVLPVTTTRWRLKFANRNLLSNTALTTPMTISDVYLGEPAFGTSPARWTGAFTSTPADVLAGFSVPTDGSDYVSPWVTAAGSQFTAGVPALLSWALSTTATGTGIAPNGCQGLSAPNGTTQVGTTGVTSPTIGWGQLYGDVRIEYEFIGSNKIGLIVGDSQTEGYGDGGVTSVLGQPGCLPHEAWPNVAALKGRFCAINLGLSSATVDGTFTNTTDYSFARADLATTVPDFAVICLGTNNLASGTTSLSYITGKYTALISRLQSLGIGQIFVATIPPRYGVTDPVNPGGAGKGGQGTLQAGVSAGALSISASVNPGTTNRFTIGTGTTQEWVLASAVSGTGPYTVTVPALANAHAAGEQIAVGGESYRQQINDWLRALPVGVQGVFDFSRALAAPSQSTAVGGAGGAVPLPGDAFPSPELFSADMLHPLRAGHQVMGTLVSAADK